MTEFLSKREGTRDPSIIRIVVASPGVVQAERRYLQALVGDLNETFRDQLNRFLVHCRWETDAYPGFHVDGPQGLIDGVLNIEDCDAFIGIFWTPFGTPGKDARSGTEHEFQRAYESWKGKGTPQIFFYFSDKSYRLHTEEEGEQYRSVLKFKRQFPSQGLWWSYKNSNHFKDVARKHLVKLITDAGRIRGRLKSSGLLIPDILKAVSELFNISPAAFTQKNNSRQIAIPRQIAMYLMKELTDGSLPEIGRQFGNKHHTTVMHSISKSAQLSRSDDRLRSTIESLKRQVLS